MKERVSGNTVDLETWAHLPTPLFAGCVTLEAVQDNSDAQFSCGQVGGNETSCIH